MLLLQLRYWDELTSIYLSGCSGCLQLTVSLLDANQAAGQSLNVQRYQFPAAIHVALLACSR